MTIRTLPLKRLADVSLGKMLQSEPGDPADVEQPYLRAASVQPDGLLVTAEPKSMWFRPAEVGGLELRAGDVVVVEGGVGGYGRAAFVDHDLPGWGFQNSINRLRTHDGVDGRFVTYALIALRASGWIRAYCNIVSMPHLTAEKLAELVLPAPAPADQQAIADYLDWETVRIDELIAEQQALVSSLGERRLAAIAEAVDDVDPLGHGRRLKHVVSSIRQGWSPQCDAAQGDGVSEWAVLKSGCVNQGAFRPEQNKLLPAETAPRPDTVIRADEVVISRASTRDLVGSAAVVPEGYPRLMLSDKLYAISLDRRAAEPEFIAMRLGTRPVRDLIELAASGASHSMQNISQADIMNLPMELPPVEEQRARLRTVREVTERIDDLIRECRDLITLLKERRSALITAAVTGKIDVRGFETVAAQPPQPPTGTGGRRG